MKARYAALLVMGGFAVIAGLKVIPAEGAGKKGIPFPSGQFSATSEGTYAICLDPSTFAVEPCSTSGVGVFPFSLRTSGALTLDTTVAKSSRRLTPTSPRMLHLQQSTMSKA
jgi:hypothetical protein